MSAKFINISDSSKIWVKSRRRKGNWIDIASDDEIPADVSGHSRTLLCMFQLFFVPEIRKRISKKEIDNDFFLHLAQLIQHPDGSQHIRLNDEVRGKAVINTEKYFHEGQPIYNEDIQSLERFEPIDEEIDCGHFTVIWTGKAFVLAFDFRSGKGKAITLLNLAKQFHWTSSKSFEHGYIGPAIDNLFSACELAAKARLILFRNPAATGKSHGTLQSAINLWGKMGNIDTEFLNILNRMGNARASARYNPDESILTLSADDIAVVKAEIEGLLSGVSPKIPE